MGRRFKWRQLPRQPVVPERTTTSELKYCITSPFWFHYVRGFIVYCITDLGEATETCFFPILTHVHRSGYNENMLHDIKLQILLNVWDLGSAQVGSSYLLCRPNYIAACSCSVWRMKPEWILFGWMNYLSKQHECNWGNNIHSWILRTPYESGSEITSVCYFKYSNKWI